MKINNNKCSKGSGGDGYICRGVGEMKEGLFASPPLNEKEAIYTIPVMQRSRIYYVAILRFNNTVTISCSSVIINSPLPS